MDHKREGYERVRELYAQKTDFWGLEGPLGEYLEGMKQYKYDQKSWEQ